MQLVVAKERIHSWQEMVDGKSLLPEENPVDKNIKILLKVDENYLKVYNKYK